MSTNDTTVVYTNGCPTTSVNPGRRSVGYESEMVERSLPSNYDIIKRQSSSNDTSNEVSGSGFDTASAAEENSFSPSISNDSPYDGLPSFDDNIAVALNSSTQGNNGTSSGSGNDEETFIALYDISKTIQLVALDSGALSLTSYGSQYEGASFGAIGSEVVVDTQSRLFVYFPDAVAKKGVSRLHVVDRNEVPEGSEIIVLVELATNAGNIYTPVDTNGNSFFLAWCNIDYGSGSVPKVFLVNDYDTGLNTLEDPDLVYTIIGGVVVGDCHELDLTSDLTPDV